MHSSQSNSRLIIFAESGLLAGDLAAWLSGRYQVDRPTHWDDLLRALETPAAALIVVDGEKWAGLPQLKEMIPACQANMDKVLLLGVKATQVEPLFGLKSRPPVHFLEAIPQPKDVLAALGETTLTKGRTMEAEG